MMLDRDMSAQMQGELAQHQGLRFLFAMHGIIADSNPMAFSEDRRVAGLVDDAHGDVYSTVEGMNIWLRRPNEEVIAMLNASSVRVSAFMQAVYDVHRAVANVGGVRGAEPDFGDRMIAAYVANGLKVDSNAQLERVPQPDRFG